MNLVETGHSRAAHTRRRAVCLVYKRIRQIELQWGNNAELIVPLMLFALMVDLSWILFLLRRRVQAGSDPLLLKIIMHTKSEAVHLQHKRRVKAGGGKYLCTLLEYDHFLILLLYHISQRNTVLFSPHYIYFTATSDSEKKQHIK